MLFVLVGCVEGFSGFAALHCTDLQWQERRPECTMAMAIRVAKRRGNVTAKERGQLARSSQVLATLPAASKRSLTRATENKCHFTQLKITEILHDFSVLNFLNWIVLHF